MTVVTDCNAEGSVVKSFLSMNAALTLFFEIKKNYNKNIQEYKPEYHNKNKSIRGKYASF